MSKPAPSNPTSNNATSQLVTQIREHILSAKLQPGERFMTEAELSERFGLSRSITREAVSRLRALGILDSRQRAGLIIGQPDPADVLAQTLPFYTRCATARDELARLRYVMETGAIELAALYATEEQNQRMAQIVDDWEHAVRDDTQVSAGFAADVQFHSLILEMSGVPLVSAMHRAVADYFTGTRWREPVWPEAIHDNAWQHRAIALAIAARDPEQARSLLRMHLGYLRQMHLYPDKSRRHAAASTPDPAAPTTASNSGDSSPAPTRRRPKRAPANTKPRR